MGPPQSLRPSSHCSPSTNCAVCLSPKAMSPTTFRTARVAAGVGILLLFAWATSAAASILYIGLADGRTVAYSTRHGRFPWLRGPDADLPAVQSNAFPTLADLDGDGVADALVGD